MCGNGSHLYFWLVDTRNKWLGKSIIESASEALKYLTEEEQAKAKAFHFLKDGKLSLASSLLKRLFIVKSLGRQWEEVSFGRQGDPKHGKPYFLHTDPSLPAVDFNVSHQASLVALAGGTVDNGVFGVDIVCVNERNDIRTIEKDGFEKFVDMFADVFSDDEVFSMKYSVDTVLLPNSRQVSGEEMPFLNKIISRGKTMMTTFDNGDNVEFNSDVIIDAKLRRFYAYWCLKEAYIKLVGEALLAKWLKKLEFRRVRCPKPATHGNWGEKVTDIEVWFEGNQLKDVLLILQSFEENYMIATAIKTPAYLSNPRCEVNYTILDPPKDIYPFASQLVP